MLTQVEQIYMRLTYCTLATFKIATFSYVTSGYIVVFHNLACYIMFHNLATAFYFSAYQVCYILI